MGDPLRAFRVLLDVNLYVSFLLARDESQSPPARIVRWLLDGNCLPVFPAELEREIRSAAGKPYLHSRISAQQLADLVEAIQGTLREFPAKPVGRIPAIRDEGDRYLLFAAIAQDADVLVTGDRDVLALAESLDRPRILTPAQFVAAYLDPVDSA